MKEGIKLEEKKYDYEKSLCATLINGIEKLDFLKNNEKQIIFKIGYEYRNNIEKIYNVYENLMNEKIVESNELTYILEKDIYILKFKEYRIALRKKDLRKTLIMLIEILQEILPLGTVVILKDEFNKGLFKTSKIFKIIITNRYIPIKDGNYYFTYVGTLYPMGIFSENKLIHFTKQSIEKIIYMGFKDIEDESYIFLKKNEMVIKKDSKSIEFATKDELDKYDTELKNK